MTTDLPSATVHDRDLHAGQQVGEYVIDEKIGEGGFGTVYRATHPLIGKRGAIKVLSRQYSANPEIVSRFIAEARAVNQIRHRNIIDIFGFGHLEDGRCFYVMEFLEGGPLDKLIAERGGLELPEAVPILRAIARALDAAHAKGIAHRDLKPENVFIVEETDGSLFPKLLDFGIAKLLGGTGSEASHKTRTGAPMGTPYYMSPEQCRGRDVDHRTDIYAFGCLCYELLTGHVPFDAEDHLSILIKQINEEPVPASQRVLENPRLTPLPPQIDDAIAWLMKKEPNERAPDLASAMHAIEEAAAAGGIELPPEPRVSHRAPTPFPRAQTPVEGIVASPTPRLRATTPAEAAATMAAAPNTGGHAVSSTTAESVAPARPRKRTLAIVLGALTVAGAAAVAFVLITGGSDATPTPPPAPAALTPAPADAAPVQPPAPTHVTIHVTGTPEGTDVFGPAGPLGRAPGDIQLVRGSEEVQLTFVADGYETSSARVRPDADRELEVELTKKLEVATKPAKTSKRPPAKRPPAKRPPPPAGSAPAPDPFSRK